MSKLMIAQEANKATFIRNYPELSTREVCELAGKSGIAIEPSYVYVVRAKIREGKPIHNRLGRPPLRSHEVSEPQSNYFKFDKERAVRDLTNARTARLKADKQIKALESLLAKHR